MTVTNLIDQEDILEELVTFLRNADVIPIATRGVTTVTEEFNGDNAEVNFTVSQTNIKNVRTVTVDAVAQTFGTDYTVNYTTGIITFTSAPASGTDNVDITYDYGNSDSIYSDFPKTTINVGSYPRIAVQITSSNSEEGSLDGGAIFTGFLISVYIYNTGTSNISSLQKSCREAILDARKDFFTVRYLSPAGVGPTIPQPERGDKVYLKTVEWLAPLNEEVLT